MARILILMLTAFLCFFCIIVGSTSTITLSSFPNSQLTPPILNILDYGAILDGRTLNTKVFEKVVKIIALYGGGTIYVPRGTFLTAPFNVTSNLTLFLDDGAVLLASKDPEDWPLLPPLPSYGQGRDHPGPRHTSFIHGENVKNIKITGNNGTIDGQGAIWWKGYQDETEHYTRGSLIEFLYSQHISISNLTLKNSPFWNIHPYSSSYISIQNVTILAPKDSPNTDGIVPDSSSHVLIEDSYIATGDDAIAIKSGWDCFGVRYNRSSSNIVIRNITVFTPNGIGLAIGSEMSGGIENVLIENCIFVAVKEAFRIKSNQYRSGYIRNITHKNITIGFAQTGIMIDLLYRDRNPSCDFNEILPLPILTNFSYISIHGYEVEKPGKLNGLSDVPINNLLLEDVTWSHFTKSYSCSNVNLFTKGNIWPPSC